MTLYVRVASEPCVAAPPHTFGYLSEDDACCSASASRPSSSTRDPFAALMSRAKDSRASVLCMRGWWGRGSKSEKLIGISMTNICVTNICGNGQRDE